MVQCHKTVMQFILKVDLPLLVKCVCRKLLLRGTVKVVLNKLGKELGELPNIYFLGAKQHSTRDIFDSVVNGSG